MPVANSTHKRAAKAALAILVVQRGHVPDWAGLGVSEAAHELGLQIGDLSDQSSLARYAQGVREAGEAVSNRRWAEYPAEVQNLARRLADKAEGELDDFFA